MTRRELREHCFKMLFCVDFYSSDEMAMQIDQYFELFPEEEWSGDEQMELIHEMVADAGGEEYLRQKVGRVLQQITVLDEKINTVAKGWKTSRMGKVELTIFRLALFEILFDEEIPNKVAVNEAVELAKKFGGNESPSFVNGILAKLI